MTRISVHQIRARAIGEMPYITRALLSLTPVMTTHPMPRPLLADDQWNIYYNPEHFEIDSESGCVISDYLDTLSFYMCGEVLRLLQLHGPRCEPLLPMTQPYRRRAIALAEMASTTLVNTILMQSGLQGFDREHHPVLHELTGSQPHRLPCVEDLLAHLLETMPNLPELPDRSSNVEEDGIAGLWSNPAEKSQKESGEGQGTGEGESEGEAGAPSELPFAPQPQPQRSDEDLLTEEERDTLLHLPETHGLSTKFRNVDAGSAASGMPRPWETQRQPCGEAPEDFSRSIRQEVAASILRDGIGREEGSPTLHYWAKQQTGQVRVPARPIMSLLQQHSETVLGCDIRRYDGRNRRQQQISSYNHCQIVLPSYHSPKLDIVFVLDTSGSMNLESLRYGCIYIASLLETLGVGNHCRMYIGDVSPRLLLTIVTPQEVRTIRLKGDGGTDMQNCCQIAVKHDRQQGRSANLCVCVTDGLTRWRQQNTIHLPLIVALVPARAYHEQSPDSYLDMLDREACPPPPWGEVSVIDIKQIKRTVDA